jgi:hypothetical protein
MNRIPRVLDASDPRVLAEQNRQPRWMSAPASEGRVRFIRTLLAERVVPAEASARLNHRLENNLVNTAQAIEYIEYLKNQPKQAGQERPARNDSVTVTEEGFYLFENEAYKVQRTKDGQRLYAKKATATDWDYDAGKGVVFRLTPEMMMSAHQIAEFGKNRGFCVVCSTGFERYISTQLGIGPSCGPKTMGKDAYTEARKALIASDPTAAAEDAMLKAQAKARTAARKAAAQAQEEVVS